MPDCSMRDPGSNSTVKTCIYHDRHCGGATGRALDLRLIGHRFKSYSGQNCISTLGKLFTPMCLCHQAVSLGTGQRAVMLCDWEGNRRPVESNGSLTPGG